MSCTVMVALVVFIIITPHTEVFGIELYCKLYIYIYMYA